MSAESGSGRFEILCEIEPPSTPGMGRVHEQLDVLKGRCDAFLVPDSHLGRATLSSLAVAKEVVDRDMQAVVCLNARDRNELGLQRDLLTAVAYGIHEILFVYGDKPSDGDRSTLKVSKMLQLARSGPFAHNLRLGVAADVRKDLPDWKHQADFVLTQMSFDVEAVSQWRERIGFSGLVYAGVVVLASEKMALRLIDVVPGFSVPDALMTDLRRRPNAGVDAAVATVRAHRSAGSVSGVQLIPARRFRESAEALGLDQLDRGRSR